MKKIFWYDDLTERLYSGEVPDDVYPEGRGLNARCRHARCSSRIDKVNFDKWTESCALGHDIAMPDKFMTDVENCRVLVRDRNGKDATFELAPEEAFS